MRAEDVIRIYTQLESAGIGIWIDGGWSVDALLEKQTRPHGDLDIAIDDTDVERARSLLESWGYTEVSRDNEWNFVMADDEGRRIDLHVFVLDDEGHVVGGIAYPDGSLAGSGRIAGHPVRCISPEHLVKFHTGYELRQTAYRAVAALCEKYGLPLPKGMERPR